MLPGFWETILIIGVLLFIFGAKRLPEVGKSVAKGIRAFKKATYDDSEILTTANENEPHAQESEERGRGKDQSEYS